MSDLEGEISALLRPVVKQLAALLNRHTAATFARAAKLSVHAPAAPGAPKAKAAPAKAKKGKAAAKAAPAKGGKGKRGAGSANLEQSLKAHIEANPGARMEEISRAIGVPTKKLQGPAAKLLAAGAVRREGETRATRYFPADGGAPAAAPAADAPKSKGKPGPKKKG